LQHSFLEGKSGFIAKEKVSKGCSSEFQVIDKEIENLNSHWILTVNKESIGQIGKAVNIVNSDFQSLSKVVQNLKSVRGVFDDGCSSKQENNRTSTLARGGKKEKKKKLLLSRFLC
jgi:hypothetical protein